MGRRFTVAILSTLFLLPAKAGAVEALCAATRPPAVTMAVNEKPVVYDATMSSQVLSAVPVTDSPYAEKDNTELNGLMHNRLAIDHVVGFRRAVNRKSGAGCVWIEKIAITIRSAPKIFIASEVHDDACRFEAIFKHEQKHTAVDHDIVIRYTARVADGLRLAFGQPADYMSGSVPAATIADAQKRLEDNVGAVLNVLYSEMIDTRNEEQQQVDTLQEYANISNSCPDSGD
jgi:hypothetical protein